jgi:hypothetical protein
MFNKFIYEPNFLVVDYLKNIGKRILFNLDDIRYHHKGTLENIVVVKFSKYNITYIIDMNDYFLWKRILKLKQLKTKMI